MSQCLLDTFFSRTSLRYSEGLCFLAAKIGGWNLPPALCDWKVESRCFPERMSIWFWESKLNLNSWHCLKIGNPKCWLIVTSQYLCHYFPINGWSSHDFQTRRPSPGGLSDGIPVCVWYLCTQPIQKRHEETWRNTMSTHIYNHLQSFTIICNHLQSFTIIYNHLQSFTIIYNHLHIIIAYIYIYIYYRYRSIDREDTPIQYYMRLSTWIPTVPTKDWMTIDLSRHLRPPRAKVHLLCATWFTCSTIHYLTLGEKPGVLVADLDPTPSEKEMYGTDKMSH